MGKRKSASGAGSTREKPELFIASARESREVALQLQAALQHDFIAKTWLAGVFPPSQYPLPSLEKQLAKAAYAVFVFTRDDVVVSRGKQSGATRDNVILELGLFVGRLGHERCFVVTPKGGPKAVKLPSDLEGFNTVSLDEGLFETDREQAATLVATAIKSAIRKLPASAEPPRPAEPASAPSIRGSEAVVGPLAEAVADVLGMLARGDAGVERRTTGRKAHQLWSKTVLKNALHVLRSTGAPLPSDAYVAWLRPKGVGAKRKLALEVADNLPDSYDRHFAFGRGEGVAGTVWSDGRPAGHTRTTPHPAWVVRPGCDNTSYVCVSIGQAGGSGGVLALGSDTGFAVDPVHESVLKVFASLLAASLGP